MQCFDGGFSERCFCPRRFGHFLFCIHALLLQHTSRRTRRIVCMWAGGRPTLPRASVVVQVLKLSQEHRLDTSPAERSRCIAAGAVIAAACVGQDDESGVGPLRVWPGGLAVSRCIGCAALGRRGGAAARPHA